MRYHLGNKLSPLNDNSQVAEVEILTLAQFAEGEKERPHYQGVMHSLNQMQYCKAEVFGTCVFGTLVIPDKNHILRDKVTIGYYLQKDKLIFIDEGKRSMEILDVMLDFEYGDNASLAYVFSGFLDLLIHDDVLMLQQLERELAELEDQLITSVPKYFYQNIIQYRKSMMVLHSYYEQLTSMGEVLQSNTNHMFTHEESDTFGIYASRTSRLHDHVEMLRDYILQIREMYQSQLDLMQNKTMNILTVVTTIFLPLTLLAGWYGMNFTNMPELTWKYSYVIMIVVSVVILSLEIWFFKKKKLL